MLFGFVQGFLKFYLFFPKIHVLLGGEENRWFGYFFTIIVSIFWDFKNNPFQHLTFFFLCYYIYRLLLSSEIDSGSQQTLSDITKHSYPSAKSSQE